MESLTASGVHHVPDTIHDFLLMSTSPAIVPMAFLMAFFFLFMTQARNRGATFVSFFAYLLCTFDHPML